MLAVNATLLIPWWCNASHMGCSMLLNTYTRVFLLFPRSVAGKRNVRLLNQFGRIITKQKKRRQAILRLFCSVSVRSSADVVHDAKLMCAWTVEILTAFCKCVCKNERCSCVCARGRRPPGRDGVDPEKQQLAAQKKHRHSRADGAMGLHS